MSVGGLGRDMPAAADPAERIVAWLALMTVVVFLVAPRASPVVLVALAVPAFFLVRSGSLPLPRPSSPLIVVALLFLGYLCINASWADHRLEAYGKVAQLVALTSLAVLAAAWMRQADPGQRESVARGALIGLAVAGLYLLFELATAHALKRWLYNVLPIIRPPIKEMTLEGGQVTALRPDGFNFNMAALQLMLWPALLLLAARAPRAGWRHAIALVVYCAAAAAAAISVHETSKAAVVVSGVIFLVALGSRTAAFALVAAGWVAAVLLVVPAAHLAYKNDLHLAPWMPTPAKQRIILWGVTAERIAEAPLSGIGVQSTQRRFAAEDGRVQAPTGFAFPPTTSRHAHNVYLQTWYELGAIGAAFLLALGLMAIHRLSRLRDDVQPYAIAAFATACVMASFSWGMWQAWFTGAFLVSAVWMALAVRITRDAS